MERIINNELLNYLVTNNLITKQQHGFIRKRCTCTNILESLHDWCLNLQMHLITDVIYFDFKKAFDSVSHPKLLLKLSAYGITGNLLAWLTDFLHHRTQMVKLDNIYSCMVPVVSGVPQGSVLGPTLFLLFINDVVDAFDGLNIKLKLYADDIKLYSCYAVNGQSSDLIEAVKRLHTWSCTWQLQIAAKKCFVCTINNCDCNTRSSYGINGETFAHVENVRDLGVTVDKHLKFDEHVSKIVHKASSRAHLILKSFRSRDKHIMVKAFCTYVRPLLEYCSPAWSPHTLCLINKIEKVQRFFTKRITGLRETPYAERLKALRLQSLEYRRLFADLVLCFKIIHGDCNTVLSDSLTVNNNSRTRGHILKLYKYPCNNNLSKYYFTNRIVNVWNSLPEETVTAANVYVFKRQLKLVDLSTHLYTYR